ncbi:MAG: ATP-binding protein [Treponema sp.]|jgi:hypothetical protein|nr:ATP-binding protein [Treponema sp.]
MSTMDILIPGKFKGKLPDGSFVHELLKNVQKLLTAAHYFPEYTLHDYRHIAAVSELSAQLIPSETLEQLKPKSVEILIGAIALHDLGMFIKPAGLRRLIFGEYKDRYNKHLNKLSWNKTWDVFYKKTRRYTDRQLLRLFGDATPVERLPSDDIPKEDTMYQRLLYGEFIRQNHHRLAFDIADIGLPGDNTNIDVFENCNCDKATKTMIGLVAQSHGMKLRDTEEFLEYYELTPRPEDVPVFYLMAVLRIADYLHIGEERASKLNELADEMHSPESRRQFHLNQAITEAPVFNYEHKSVYITANPKCSSTYEDVEDRLRTIQRELDYCWAILQEKNISDCELLIHRLRSNLDDENKVASFNDRFLTRKAALDVNPDIVKHLIGPLYDNNPSYGVRELIQNAVDACNERSAIDKNVVGRINIRIDTEKRTFEINDNGVGMNEDILRNYFLVAGSSYRYSDAWREKYLTDDGEAKIARTGRFGIGALASFLIGDEITVTTRHIDDRLGFQFTFSKEPKTLDVIRKDTDEPGTRIEIKMHEKSSVFFKFPIKNDSSGYTTNWNEWFCFSKPEVCYFLNGKRIKGNIFTIQEKDDDKDGWYDVKSNIFPHMKLRHIDDTHRQIIVNGIIVAKNPYDGLIGFSSSFEEMMGRFSTPAISLIDRDNKLDIDLKRTKILNFPELALVAKETFKYYLANLLVIPENHGNNLILGEFADNPIVVSNSGYTLFSPPFISHTKQQKVIALYHDYNDIFEMDFLFPAPIVLFKYEPEGLELRKIVEDQFLGSKYWSFFNGSIDEFSVESIDESEEFIDNLMADESILKIYNLDESGPNSKRPPLGLTLSEKLPLIIECSPTKSAVKNAEIALELLREYIPNDINDGWIPFNMDKRKELYPKAFSELERYMQDSHRHYKLTEF